MNEKIKGLIALSLTLIFWSLSVVISRAIIHEFSAFAFLFIRLIVATLAFLPFIIKRKVWRHPRFNLLLIVSLTFMVNMTFFVLGIQFTSASASQMIYGATPILIVIIGMIFLKEKYSLGRIMGVIIGLLGIIMIFYFSVLERGLTISGSLRGNLLIGIAVVGWIAYMLITKKVLKIFSAIDTSSISIMLSLLLSAPFFVYEEFSINSNFNFSTTAWLGIIFVGFFGTFITYILHQYALSRLSALTTSFTTYIQPISTAFLEIIFLKAKLTPGFLFGGLLVFSGVFLATTIELLQKRN